MFLFVIDYTRASEALAALSCLLCSSSTYSLENSRNYVVQGACLWPQSYISKYIADIFLHVLDSAASASLAVRRTHIKRYHQKWSREVYFMSGIIRHHLAQSWFNKSFDIFETTDN